jgi:hypothetical protein
MTKRNINVRVGTPVPGRLLGRKPIIQDPCYIDVESNISDLINNLDLIQQKYGDEYTNLAIGSEPCSSCYSDCSCESTFYVYGTRLESDLEYNYRIEKEADTKAKNEAADREVYEKLKAKFGD